MNECTWPLGTGQTIEFTIDDPDTTTWNAVAGLYIFAYYNGQHWIAVYVGQTEDFSTRIPNHEKWDSARRLGATHIHAKVVPQAATRDTLEQRLIEYLQPVLNVQYRDLRRSGS